MLFGSNAWPNSRKSQDSMLIRLCARRLMMRTPRLETECVWASGTFSSTPRDPAPPIGHRTGRRVTQEPHSPVPPVREPGNKDTDGFVLDCRLGARRRTAGRRSCGGRRLAGATGTSRPGEWAARTTGPAGEGWGSPAGTTRSAREAGLPRPVPGRAPRAPRTAGSEHAVVIAVALVVVPEDYGAGEEDDRQDEKDPGDDHDPRCGCVEPGRLGRRGRRRRRSCGDGSRLDRGFGCFAHALNIALAHNRRNTFRQQTCCESRRESSVAVPE